MTEPSQTAADPEWKQLSRLGELLVELPSAAKQCRLLTQTLEHLFASQAQVWLARPAYPLPGAPMLETLPDAPASPLVHQAFLEQKMLRASDSPSTTDAAASAQCVALPLMVHGVVLGIVEVCRPAGPAFKPGEISLLEGLASHAAVAMEISRQETLKNWRDEQLALVRSVSAQIASLVHLDQLYSEVTHLIQRTFSFYYVGIFLVDARQNVLRFRGSASINGAFPIPEDFLIEMGEGIIGSVAENGVEIVAPDIRQNNQYRHLDGLPETLSEAALPLKIENTVLGVLDFQSDQTNAFDKHDMLVLRALADNISLAIESKRLYSHLERRAVQISSVFEVSHALTSILDPDELLRAIVHSIHSRFGYPFVHIYTVHPGRQLVIYQGGSGERSQFMQQEGRHYQLQEPIGIIPWVARNGRTFLSNDVTIEPLYRPANVPPYDDTRAELAVPIKMGEEVLGVLDLQSRTTNAFDENDRSLFEALAAPIAIAMRNANLYRSEQWRRRVAESFRDAAQLVSANLPIQQLLDFILEKLETILPCDASAIWLVQDDTGSGEVKGKPRLRLAATRNISVDQIFESLQEKGVFDILERALYTEIPLIRKPEEAYGPLGASLNFRQDYSSIAAPMQADKQPLGVLTLAHHQNGRYGSESQAITATFASYAAVAIRTARLYTDTQEQALISTMLLQVAEASQSTMTIDDLLSTMIRLTRLLMGVQKCAFFLWDEVAQQYALKNWYGFEPEGVPAAEAAALFPAHLPAFSRLRADQAMITLGDPAVELQLPEFRLTSPQSRILMLPLLVRREVLGAFLVGLHMAAPSDNHTVDVEPEASFDYKALAILQGIAHQTAMTVDNLRLLEARQEEAYVTAALLQVSEAVATANDLNESLDTITHLLPILVGIETCVIYLWDVASQLFRPAQVAAQTHREEEAIWAHAFAPGDHQLLSTIRQTGRMSMCQISQPDLPFEEWGSLACIPYEDNQSQNSSRYGDWLLGYPLSLQGQVLGVMLVREMTVTPAFWERRLEIINGIAQQVTLAIQNDILKQEMVQTERIEREMHLARQIQETFLPDTLPQIDRWELDMRWETARQIGGDFYDIFKLDNNRLGLVIADVADKGLAAALYMTVARTLIRAGAFNNNSPAEVLQEVNRLLINDSTDSMFITVVYAILSLGTGEMVYANAGHNRPLLYRRKTGQLDELPKGGTALGILNDLELHNHLVKIGFGDALVLFTDGVTDILSPEGEAFGAARMQAILHQHGKEKVQDLLEALDDAMIEFRRGTPPADDVTLLAVRREPLRRAHGKASLPTTPLEDPPPPNPSNVPETNPTGPENLSAPQQ